MSCIDSLKTKGYSEYVPYSPTARAYTLDNEKIGRAKYEGIGNYAFLAIYYVPKAVKRLKIRYQIYIGITGSDPTKPYYCATGFGIRRIVLWVLSPIEILFEQLNTIVNIFIILQLLNALIGGII